MSFLAQTPTDPLPLFVAEVSSNHNRDLTRSLQFIDVAAKVGCAAVKFQLFQVDKLFAPEILSRSAEHRQRRAWELPEEFLPTLRVRCREVGLAFSCTPFYLEAVEELRPYVDFYKLASYEILWHDLLHSCAQTGVPVVLSTGMATLDEISAAVTVLRQGGCTDLTLLHCVSGYPTPPEDCNLAAIRTLRDTFGCPVGWSDHSINPAVVCRAVHLWDAAMVEFHLDLDGRGDEFAAGHCWLPEQIAPVIRASRRIEACDGNGIKTPAPCELPDRDWRADSSDGLRPLRRVRGSFRG